MPLQPDAADRRLQVNWNHLTVPGLSHQGLQFQGTGNRELASVDLYLDRFFAEQQPSQVDILQFRGFLRAPTVPPKGAAGVFATAPPQVLFIWPSVVTVERVVSSVDFHYRQFAIDGSVLVYTASVTFEEILDTRVTSEELREELDESAALTLKAVGAISIEAPVITIAGRAVRPSADPI